jgi:DHA1 family bicyclomycin/chloramphenicol resistance-like MFS transporter
MARAMSLVTLVMGVAPVLAPLLGGGLLAVAGWRAIFACLTVVGTALGVLAFATIPETRPPGHAEPLRLGLATMFRDRHFLAFSLAGGCAGAGMFAYISGAPGVFIHQLGASPTLFALLFGLNASGLIGLSQYNRVLLEKRPPQRIASFGIGLGLVAACALLAVARFAPAIGTIAPLLFCFVASLGLITANTIALALEHHGRRAGLASALLGTLQFGISALASALVSFFARETAVPMAAVMLGCASAAAVLLALGLRTPGDVSRAVSATGRSP